MKGKKAKVRKLTPSQKQIRLLEERSQNLERELQTVRDQLQSRIRIIVERDEKIDRVMGQLADVKGERDRLVRVIDQFTSISIVPLGGDVPSRLRKT